LVIFSVAQQNTKLINAILTVNYNLKTVYFMTFQRGAFDLAFNLNFESVNTLDNAGRLRTNLKKRFVSRKVKSAIDGVDRS
jgi:hypothetical protein